MKRYIPILIALFSLCFLPGCNLDPKTPMEVRTDEPVPEKPSTGFWFYAASGIVYNDVDAAGAEVGCTWSLLPFEWPPKCGARAGIAQKDANKVVEQIPEKDSQ